MDEQDTILIIDDDEGTRKTLTFILKKKGFEVVTAGTGEEGLLQAKGRKILVALLDINLPDIEGIRLIAPLKEMHPGLPVIMITGYASMENAMRALNEGATGYILKPVKIDEILAKIQDALERQRLIRNNELAEEALRASEEKYRNLIENINDVIFSLDDKGVFTYISPVVEKISGYPPSHLTGHPFTGFIVKDDLPGVMQAFEAGLRGAITSFPFRIVTKSGDRRWLSVSSYPAFTNGNLSGVHGVLSDITERKQAEEALRESEEKFRGVAERSSDLIILTDMTGTATYVSPSVTRILGFTPDEITGKKPSDFIAPDDMGVVYDGIRKNLEGVPTDNIMVHILKKDGSYAIMDIAGSAITKENKIAGVQVLGRDITERKRAEEALRESEEKFRIIADYTYDWEYWIAPDGTFTYMSPSCERVTGYSAKEFYQKPALFNEIIHPDDTAAYRGHMDLSYVSTNPESVEYRIVRKDGGIRWISHICQPMYGDDGKLVGRRSSNRDITERHQAEIALRESEEKYRAFFATSMDCVFITTLDGRWIDFNDAAIALFGYDSREELFRVAIREMYADPEARDAHIQYIRERGHSLEYPVNLRKKDGTVINTLITSVARADSEGNIIGFQGTVRDITEKKIAQDRIDELLRLQEEQLRIINTSPAVAFLWRAEENWPVEMVSRNISQFGYSVDDFLSGTVMFGSVIHPDDLGRIGAEVEYNGAHNIDEYTQVYRILGKDRTEYWIEDYTHIRRDKTGKITHYEGLVLDITERKRAEDALQKSEHRSATLLQAIPDMMFVLSRDGIYRDFSVPDKTALAVPADQIIGKNIRDAGFDKEMADAILRHIAQTIDTDTLQKFEYELMVPHGVRHYEARLVALSEDEVLGIVRDITEHKRAEEEIKRAVDRFKTVMDSIDALVYVADMKTYELLFINKYGKDIWGEIEGQVCWQSIQSGQAGPCPFCTNDRLVGPDGQPTGVYNWEFQNTINGHWYDCRDSAIVWLDGSLVRLEIATDITGRKEIEEALQESEEKFREIFNNANDGIEIVELQDNGMPGRFTDVNEVACRMLGYTWEEMLRVSPLDIGTDYFSRPFDEILQELHTAGHATFETEHRRKDGIIVPVEVNSHKVTLMGKTVFLSIVRNITERRLAEQALRESEQKFRDLFENSRDGIAIAEPATHKFIDSNETFSRMLGYLPEEMKNLGIQDIHPKDRVSYIYETLEKMVREGNVASESLPVKRKDGTLFYADISAYPITIANKRYFVGVFRDITERRQAEELQKHFTEELEEQVKSRTLELETSLNEKLVLLREVHHRVKNNLQIIISLVNLQMRKLDDPHLKQVMAETQNRVRAMSLVHEKLYQSESLSRIDFADYSRYLATQLVSYYGTDTRRVKLDYTMGEIMVDINTAVPLGLMMNELISNSLKHAFPGGREGKIRVSGGIDDHLITLVVSDNGIGMPEELDWRNTTSLGMRLVTSLIDQIDGTLTLDRKNGTTWTVTVKRDPGTGADRRE